MNIETINQILNQAGPWLVGVLVFCSVIVSINDPDGAPRMAKAIAFVSIAIGMLGGCVLVAALIVKFLTGRSVFPSLGV